jgi:hypothetical protein
MLPANAPASSPLPLPTPLLTSQMVATDTATAIPGPPKLPGSPPPPRRNKPRPRSFRGQRGGVQPFAQLGVQGGGEAPGAPPTPSIAPHSTHIRPFKVVIGYLSGPYHALTAPYRHPMPTWKDPCPRAPAPTRSGSGSCQAPQRLWVSAWVRAAIWQKLEPTQWPGADTGSAARRQSAGLVALSAPSRERSRGTNPQQSGVNLGNGYLP